MITFAALAGFCGVALVYNFMGLWWCLGVLGCAGAVFLIDDMS